MGSGRASLAVVALTGLLAVPAATAKFRVSLTLDPARPRAGTPVRVTLRTEAAPARGQGIELHAVGPWRQATGQAILLVRLVPADGRTFRARLRFPYAGRWHLHVPPPGASPSLDRWVRVSRR